MNILALTLEDRMEIQISGTMLLQAVEGALLLVDLVIYQLLLPLILDNPVESLFGIITIANVVLLFIRSTLRRL